MSSVGTPTENHFNHHHLLPSKRKLEDFDSMNSTSNSCKGKSVINYGTPTTVENSGGESSQSSNCSSGVDGGGGCGGGNGTAMPSAELQFFVRNFSGGKTLVLRANYEDTVQKVHQMIEKVTGIPVIEQGLIYRGKQLQWEQTLRHCGVQNDAGLQLVGRMRSTHHPKAWQCINDMISVIFRICRKELPCYDGRLDGVKKSLLLFIGQGRSEMKHGKTNKKKVNVGGGGGGGGGDDDDDDDDEDDHGVEGESIDAMDKCKIFMDACGPQGLVMLYVSKEKCNQECADECIRSFVSFVKNSEGKGKGYCIKVVLELCKLLRMMVAGDDPLYLHCRSSLGSMLEKVEVRSRRERLVGRNEEFEGEKDGVVIGDMLPFLNEVGERLVKDLTVNVELDDSIGPLNRDVCDFSAFLQPVLRFIDKELKQAAGRVKAKGKTGPLADEVGCLSSLFNDILCWIDKSLKKMELYVAMKSKKDGEVSRSAWSQYIAILKELHSISLLYPGSEDHFWSTMRQNKAAVCDLIVRYAKRSVDNSWILKHKEVLDFPARRHLAMLLFPDVREDYDELHEMLIDRSNLLAESFEYISNAQSSSLHAGLFMEFKNEEATGPGVLREWFCLVCQAIFDPQNALFVSCPLDRRRFFPSPASKVHALHLRYFEFSGRVIALALMHKIQVGVVLDRVFFLQLAGRHVSIDDIHDADPCLYKSCKQILEMDADFVDSDGLGLTFITDVEELGTMKAVELCSGGKGIAVNSKNRKEYVDLIVQHHFVTSIKEQVSHFAKGFADILSDGKYRETFFDSLELEDLDWMLHGSGNEICVEDWMSHTEYHGYKQSDPQIVWFWEVVRKLNAEQKKTLLFFWTSVKYLPVEGFRGLASRLYIYKSLDPPDNLPSSHTCFYRICIPQYPSKAVMRKRLLLITQEHVGCSFGTW